MNRAQRRQAARQKPMPQERFVPLPPLMDEWTVFNNIETILAKLANGAIEHANGVPVFLDETGAWFEVCPALAGWISCWERIDREMQLDLQQEPLTRILNKLRAVCPLTEAEVTAAGDVIDTQRIIFRHLPRQRLRELAKTEQIALLINEPDHTHCGD